MSIAVTLETFVIKLSKNSFKTVRVAYYDKCFQPEVYAWGKTQGKSPSIRVLKNKIKTFLINEAGFPAKDASREARGQARYMRTGEAKRMKKLYCNREQF
jgi:hypothetical protein